METEEDEELGGVFGEAPVAELPMLPLAFDDLILSKLRTSVCFPMGGGHPRPDLPASVAAFGE